MTVVIGPVIWVVSGVVGLIVADLMGLPPRYQIGVALAGFITGGLFHWYSPIPNHNGGFGMGTPRIQKWGFTTERRDDGGESDE